MVEINVTDLAILTSIERQTVVMHFVDIFFSTLTEAVV